MGKLYLFLMKLAYKVDNGLSDAAMLMILFMAGTLVAIIFYAIGSSTASTMQLGTGQVNNSLVNNLK